MQATLINRFEQENLYFVTCEQLSFKKDIEVIKDVLKGGCKLIQLRDKKANQQTLLKKAHEIRKITNQYNALFIVNDHINIAIKSQADGVHLGQKDTNLKTAKQILLKNNIKEFLIGVSCHSLEDLLIAQENQANYINIGPIFSTTTKQANTFLGITTIQKLLPFIQVPFSVMGGIKEKHFQELFANKVKKIAVITEITQQKNIVEHTKKLKAIMKNFI